MASAAAAKEVAAAVELLISDQPQVGFVNEGGGIEGVAGGFRGHARGGELPQFVIDEREQIRSGLTVSFLNGFDQTGDIRHFKRVYRSQDRPSRGRPGRHIKVQRMGGFR